MTQCMRCGFVWQARVTMPKACPRCKSYAWQTKRKTKPKLVELPKQEFEIRKTVMEE